MGDEIERRYFDADDFSAFRRKLDVETELLREHFRAGEFSPRGNVAGFELEAWLIDGAGDPLACNAEFLRNLDNPLVVPELAAFNVELNGSPSRLTGRVFSRLLDELTATWDACAQTAVSMDCDLVTIGILPTVKVETLNSQNISEMLRYKSLNDRVIALRDGRPLTVYIEGGGALDLVHHDVMLEAATTSFQIHLQCPPQDAVRDFNASLAVSGLTVAASANSPLLFGKTLWDETRIPLFEQAVDVGERNLPRVTFGTDYVHESLMEVFDENQRDHPILLPAIQDSEPNHFKHVRLQNGTLWRWNRPLIGFDFDGQVHLRIEHRVVPAGPTLIDCIANSALYFGLVKGLGLDSVPIEARLPFASAQSNFYNCARYGLNARVFWPTERGDQEISVRKLIIDELLATARRGLESVEVPRSEIDEYLDIIGARVDSSQNGAAWQRRWIAKNGPEFNELVLAYKALQDSGRPVHTWPL